MGVMRFKVHPLGLLDSAADIQHAYVSGYDGRVFPSRVEVDGNVVAIRRTNAESGKLNIAYPVQGFGKPVVSTSTLREQEAPYNLALELARGKICQVRNQLATWEALGMQIPADFAGLHRESHKLFAQATAAQTDVEQSTQLANQAITKSHEAAERLTRNYVRQRLQVRFKRTPQLPVSFGCQVNGNDLAAHGTQLTETFNAVSVPVEWTRIEPEEGAYHWENCDEVVNWAHDRKLLMRGGPLLDFSENGLPGWLQQWSHDVLNLQSFLCDFVETAVSRYQGKIRIWELATRANTGGAFKLSEEERLSVMAKTLEVARQVDGDAQFFLRIDQPWGGYQAQGEHRLSPCQFVDALLRFGTGLAGVNLEVPVGYSGRGMAPRDLLEFSRMLDLWTILEVPLHVTLAFPSSGQADSCASANVVQETNGWRKPWSGQSQAEWIDAYVSLLMAKQAVVGIYWTHLSDASEHVFPNAGLVDAKGLVKPGFEALLNCRTGQSLS